MGPFHYAFSKGDIQIFVGFLFVFEKSKVQPAGSVAVYVRRVFF